MALSNIDLVTFCVNAFHVHTETYRVTRPCVILKAIRAAWGWLGLACESIGCLDRRLELVSEFQLSECMSTPKKSTPKVSVVVTFA